LSTTGELLEESQLEASKLRQKAEDLVKDNKMLVGSSSLEDLVETGAIGPDPSSTQAVLGSAQPDREARKSPPSGSSSEFEVVAVEAQGFPQEMGRAVSDSGAPGMWWVESRARWHRGGTRLCRWAMCRSCLPGSGGGNQPHQVSPLGTSLLKRLASKVHKNEQRTSFLQTLCETLHSENNELRTKLERDLEQRNQALEKLRCENQELRRMVMLSSQDSGKREAAEQQQSGTAVEKAPGRGELEAKEKKVKILEHQRRELLEVNKQWDQHFRATKQKYEQKVTDLQQELAEARRALTELESEREQKQRDFDRKLLLAKSRIETEEAEKERLAMEVRDLQQRMRFLQEQLAPVTRQREYQEKEIQRLNKEADRVSSALIPPFSQLRASKEDCQREKEEKEKLKKLLKQHKQASGERLHAEPLPGPLGPACPVYQYQYSPPMAHPMCHGFDEWQQIRYPPAMPSEHTPGQNFHHFPPVSHSLVIHIPDNAPFLFHLFPQPEYPWRPPCAMARSQNAQAMAGVKPVPK
ncbi:TNIP1 protein, partial [Columbina picui]|nr:TNIP1 protein [Columbina picui]